MKSKLSPKREAELRLELKTITKELKALTKRFRDIKKRAQTVVEEAKTSSKLKDLRARLNQIK